MAFFIKNMHFLKVVKNKKQMLTSTFQNQL